MISRQTYTASSILRLVGLKVQDYLALSKHKLTMTVVFTSALGFLIGGASFLSFNFFFLLLGGFLVTASANAMNQVLEKDFDAMMKRTMNRPLPTKRIGDTEGWLFAGLAGTIGTIILWSFFGPTCALLGIISIVSYAFIYTPLKRIHPIAVFIGAFPGALPPVIGYIAATGQMNVEALLLFGFQFLWQFPHFWAIAWLAFDDYKKAGYRLLPTGKKDLSVPVQSILFIALLGILSFIPYVLDITSILASTICFLATVFYLVPAVRLFYSRSNEDAKKLMFASFIYLPIVFTAFILF